MHGKLVTRVLVADDNVDAGESLGSFFEMLGLRAVVVRDGADAVECASREMPDVAILDLGMPGLDGWEACRRIRSLPGGARARIVALSGWDSKEAQEKSALAGFDAHWTKPADIGAILTLLRPATASPGDR